MSSLITTYLTIAAMLTLTTFPVLIPMLITAGHAIRRRISEQARTAYLPTVPRQRLAAA